jgi:hypothetical protein
MALLAVLPLADRRFASVEQDEAVDFIAGSDVTVPEFDPADQRHINGGGRRIEITTRVA